MQQVWLKALFTVFFAGFANAAVADCVVLLHGLARTSSSMQDLEQAFVERGYRVANIDYPSREYSIEQLSDLVFEQALSACAALDDGQVHFVTHSLGGILVRYYLAHHKLPNLGRVVMLAPPNQGSEVIDQLGDVPGFELIGGPSSQQLGTGPDNIPPQLGPVDYPVGVIAGTRTVNPILSQYLPNPDDGKVSVARTRVEGMTDFITVPVSHPFIMGARAAIRQAVAFIETGAFVHDENP
jgi:pimeloyl-ACP methyl ester carboxylesterase